MSGIVGIIEADKVPVKRELLAKMTEFMASRGPDAQNIWAEGKAGFGHTLLRTTQEAVIEHQPFTLDNQVWIVADVRVDGRKELIEKLQQQGEKITLETPDPNLILHAYKIWGIDCLEHLIGDFVFAIWDRPKQLLFCARDHFGVKPFYYARKDKGLVFSNTLNCIRLHPGVSDKLNDLAIVDFLLFGYNQEVDTTAFADIQRLPAAHRLIWSLEGLKVEKYWTLPTDDYIRYQRDEEYVEEFLELMRLAVGDRLRTNQVAVYMSGGLDSTSVTAIAKQLLSQQYPSFNLQAYTSVFDRLIPDEERYYSGLVAEHLGIPINYQVLDDVELYKGIEEIEGCTPEPSLIPLTKTNSEHYQTLTSQSRIVLSGQGGDGVFYSQGAYYYGLHLIKIGQVGKLVVEWIKYFGSHGCFPQPGIRTQVKQWLGIPSWKPSYPLWLNPDLEQQLDLRTRWENSYIKAKPIHPVRPEAYQSLISPFWSYLFEGYDAGINNCPIEVRYPYFDLRLVKFLLSIPVVPWMMFKEMLRVSMKGLLPENVRCRPKTPAMGNPITLRLQQPGMEWLEQFAPTCELSRYLNREAIPSLCGMTGQPGEAWINLRPISLNLWLQQLPLVYSKSKQEADYVLTA